MDSLLRQVNEILGQYTKNVDDRMKDVIEDASKRARDELRATSPKGPEGYAKSWSVKKGKGSKGIQNTVYNKDHYRLTHLLENGHAVKNQHGSYGFWKPKKKHIQPVNDWVVQELPIWLEEALRDVD